MIDPECPGTIEPILDILEGKWTLLILRDLFNGLKRFGELRRSLHPISPKTLTDRLRLLEERGIVTRTIFPGVPLHVEYELTERGKGLQPIFAYMYAWAEPAPDIPPTRDAEGMIEAPIVLVREGADMRHFVGEEPVQVGSSIEVRFGNGWIEGRYEWRAEDDSLIQIHSGSDVLYIREGHVARVKR